MLSSNDSLSNVTENTHYSITSEFTPTQCKICILEDTVGLFVFLTPQYKKLVNKTTFC